MNHFDPFGMAFWATVGTAVLCGGIIGCERQLRGKPAGIRTSILVCLGSAVFIHLGSSNIGAGDPTRVLGQLITGVGFLGAGVMFSKDGAVTGVATAAVIWVLAAIGAAIGLDYHLGALTLSVITVGLLVGIEVLETSIRRLRQGAHAPRKRPRRPPAAPSAPADPDE